MNVFRLGARLVPTLVVAAGIAFAPQGAFAVDPGPKCESGKIKEVAKKAKKDANVYAKSIKKNEAADAAKLAKNSTKFNEKWTKLETKGAGACPTNGDAATVEASIDACILDVISDLGGAPQGDGDEVKCQSKKAKEAGKYAQCRLKADSKGVKKGEAPDYIKCDTKLSAKWAKIESKPPCGTTGDVATVKADIDACQAAITTALTGNCGNGVIDAGEQCDDGNTTGGDGCSATCQNEPLVEYLEDFEGLVMADPQALEFNGWLVGANVFAGLPGTGGAFLYNYFAFPAPNGGAAFSAIVAGEGGAEQGAQQMSIYNDYNNGDHGNGNTIEANVFQERMIVAGDVGRTFTFQFDHKIGNMNDPGDAECPSTQPGFVGTPCNNNAQVFIKVFDPGFALLDFPTADMTSIPGTWGTTLVTTAPIPGGAVGGVLQFGALSNASLYQPSGIFYDNMSFSSLP